MYLYEENTAVASHLEVADRLKIFLTQTLGWSAVTDAVIGGIHRWVYHSKGSSAQEDIYIQVEHDPADPNRLLVSGWAYYNPVTNTGVFQLVDGAGAAPTLIADGFTPTEVNFYGDDRMFIIVVRETAMGGLAAGNYFGLIDPFTRRQQVAVLTQEALVPPGVLGGNVDLFVTDTEPFTAGSYYQLSAEQGIASFVVNSVDPGVSINAKLFSTPLGYAAWPVGSRISSEPTPLLIGADSLGLGKGYMFNFQPSLDPYQKRVSAEAVILPFQPVGLSLKEEGYAVPIYIRTVGSGGGPNPVETRGVLRRIRSCYPGPFIPFDSGDTLEDQDGKTHRLYRVWGPTAGFEIGGVAIAL